MTLLTEIRKIAQIGSDGKLLPSQAPDIAYPVTSVAGRTGDINLVVSDVVGAAPLNSPVFTGNPVAPTAAVGDNDTSIATTAFVKSQGYATLDSPILTGTPVAPTPAVGDNDTSIATTAFVKSQGYAIEANLPVTSVAGKTGDVTLAIADITGGAPLASPALTGNPTAPTPGAADNDTSIATTAFVKSQGYTTPASVNSLISAYGTAAVTASVFGANGFVKFNNGLLVQWGTYTGNGSTVVYLPTTFSASWSWGLGALTSGAAMSFAANYFVTGATSGTEYRYVAIGY